MELDEFGELFRFHQNLRKFRLGSNRSIVIADNLPLPSASVGVVTERIRGFGNREFSHVERNPVVTSADQAIASTFIAIFAAWSAAFVSSLSADAPSSAAPHRILNA